MMKRTQLILLFMLVLSGVVLLGIIPAAAQSTTNITGVRVDDGAIVTDISGQTPINPCYNDPLHPELGCQQMILATDLWICDQYPLPTGALEPDLTHCRKFNYSTFGVAYNYWTVIGGINVWVPGLCTTNAQCGAGRVCRSGVCYKL